MRFNVAVAVLGALVVAAAVVPDAKPHGAKFESGWTAYAPLSSTGSPSVYAYPDEPVVAPPGAVPARRGVVRAVSQPEIQVIR